MASTQLTSDDDEPVRNCRWTSVT